jgi:DNA-binding NarL/FixJ family response regulator
MLEALRLALDGLDDIEIVGEASSGSEVLPLVGRTDPDLVLLDVRMPGMDGLTCIERLRRRYPSVRIAMLSGESDRAVIDAALQLGADAYILKTIDPRDLPSALRQASEQTVFQTPAMPADASSQIAEEAGLSPSEVKVLRSMALGMANKEIAKELWLSDQTVKFHLRNIYRKLGVSNRTEAARHAHQHGLVGHSYREPATVAA